MGTAVVKNGNSRYATAADFRTVFAENRSSLYRLSLLLLRFDENIEQCIQLALDECIETASVFEPFAKSWARRCTIRNAFQLTDMRKEDSSLAVQTAQNDDGLDLDTWAVCKNIIALSGLQRFVFVMSALEHYNDQECSILLRCSRNDVCDARARTWKSLEETCGVNEKTCIASVQAWLTYGDRRPERGLKRAEDDMPNRVAAIHFHFGDRCPLAGESL